MHCTICSRIHDRADFTRADTIDATVTINKPNSDCVNYCGYEQLRPDFRNAAADVSNNANGHKNLLSAADTLSGASSRT
jgi:hypothetical protein